MTEELTPTEQEIRWWEEAQDAAEEAEALCGWLDSFIERFDIVLRRRRYDDVVVEDVSALKQVRDSLAWAWGLPPQSSPALAK